ncbi:hypothetical protein [Saccharopolyspora spinosa]|uniref:Uncharacterized protein n=1 Tax=Saccharopolyspora spinosa TaxID=60894 RepID=A0A2N3XU00_SACSN|nr:hypothetical protein [Saccharopolyspora spinosa]PKW14157.1 hypothetical protein A8926_1752 [Saccharopolyspora spinosa]
MTRLVEALVITLGLLILGVRFLFLGLFTAGLPTVGLLVAALVSGAVRTAVLVVVFPLVVLGFLTIVAADAAGGTVPAPRLPRPLEVTPR